MSIFENDYSKTQLLKSLIPRLYSVYTEIEIQLVFQKLKYKTKSFTYFYVAFVLKRSSLLFAFNHNFGFFYFKRTN